jgi:hypothetical protein
MKIENEAQLTEAIDQSIGDWLGRKTRIHSVEIIVLPPLPLLGTGLKVTICGYNGSDTSQIVLDERRTSEIPK